jgi:hypothetical protein
MAELSSAISFKNVTRERPPGFSEATLGRHRHREERRLSG